MMIINCDMAEGMGNEELIMPYIHAANISCGLHAGNDDVIRETIKLAQQYGVSIGAHPSFDDRGNFGRREIHLQAGEIYELVFRQLKTLSVLAASLGETIRHVKPHGALYNMSAKDKSIAHTIATAVKDFSPGLVLVGLSGSASITEAGLQGLKTYEEGFADRHYNADGSLVSRNDPRALITDVAEAIGQVRQLQGGSVTAVTGEIIPIRVDTVCIHGDSPGAVSFARAIFESLAEKGEPT